MVLVMLPIASSVNAQKRKQASTQKITTTKKSTSTTNVSSTDDPYQRALHLCNGGNYVQGAFTCTVPLYGVSVFGNGAV